MESGGWEEFGWEAGLTRLGGSLANTPELRNVGQNASPRTTIKLQVLLTSQSSGTIIRYRRLLSFWHRSSLRRRLRSPKGPCSSKTGRALAHRYLSSTGESHYDVSASSHGSFSRKSQGHWGECLLR